MDAARARRAAVIALGFACAAAACAPGNERGDAAGGATAGGDVVFSARTALLGSYPVRLRTTVTAVNRGAGAAGLRFPDGCVVLVRAHSRDGRMLWDQGDTVACTEALVEVTLAPGDSATFETQFTASDVLGDSLPDDVYVLRAYVRPLGRETVVLEAGRANLVVPRPP
jgi:hypothetical protein